MTVDPERYVVTRTIAARPEQIFAVLADPCRHHNTEPGDWVRDAVDTAPITGTGQVFAMNMYLTAGRWSLRHVQPGQCVRQGPCHRVAAGCARQRG
jgi:hypothetical protein